MKSQQALPGTSAATYELMEPHKIICPLFQALLRAEGSPEPDPRRSEATGPAHRGDDRHDEAGSKPLLSRSAREVPGSNPATCCHCTIVWRLTIMASVGPLRMTTGFI